MLERNDNIFYHIGEGSQYGVGFLVAKKWKNNIMEFVGYSDRVAVLKFRIGDGKVLTVIQVYAPTSTHPDEEVEEWYDVLNKACDEHRGTWTLVIGDFNAKVGPRNIKDNPNIMGPYGLRDRNVRGRRLLKFAFGQNLALSNSFFSKKPQRRWTWFSMDGATRNEIDFCLSSNKHTVQNVETLNSLKFSSDHRPLRTTIKINMKIHRNKMVKDTIRKLDKFTLIANKEQFKLELKNSFSQLDMRSCDNVDTQYKNIRDSIKKASQQIKSLKLRTKKLTNETLKLIEERQKFVPNSSEHRASDRKVKRSIRRDIRAFNTNLVQSALDKNKSLRSAMRGREPGRSTITCLKDRYGVKQGDRDKILQISTQFYMDLYSEDTPHQTIQEYSCPDTIEPITGYEVHRAITSLKYNRSPGEDSITTEALKIGEHVLNPHITNLFNIILKTGSFPRNFCHSNIILLYKKGDKSDIGNYRPISLVSHIYKTFIKILEFRISGQLDKKQPPEQAGFRRGLSTTDHLHSLNQIIEKHQEYKVPLYLAFVDYSKAFDSLKHPEIFKSLENQGIESTYVQLLQHIYINSTASIHIHTSGPSFQIQKGVKQGDPLSPKLFTSTLEEVFQTLSPRWKDKGIVVGDKRLTNLRFADDIVLFSTTAAELETMLQDLSRASLGVGLSMNMTKTKVMTNGTQRKIEVEGVGIEYVHEYIYLGQLVSFQARQEQEIARRTENAWKSYWSMKDLMKGPLPLSLKRKLMDICILPILTYGAQTWSLTNRQKSSLGVCQRAMERSILGVKLTDRIRNSVIRSRTQVADVAQKAGRLKWDWAGHVCRMPDTMWAKTTTEWLPNYGRRPRGRPRRRWRDELNSYLKDWPLLAINRDEWKEGREAFALQWDTTGL